MNKYTLLILTTIFLISCNKDEYNMNNNNLKVPKAFKNDTILEIHNHKRIDSYFWMRLSDEQKASENPDKQTIEVTDYLKAENSFLNKSLAHTNEFQKKLYDEIISRFKQKDESVPVLSNGYFYYSKYEEGSDYPISCRKKSENSDTKEEILLNVPELAKDFSYYSIGSQSVSTNNQLLAYSYDNVSRRQYTIVIKNLNNNELLSDKIENTTGSITWANDNRTIFYTKKDPITLRANQIFKHTIGTNQSDDEFVYEEKDDTFTCSIYKSRSKKYLIINSNQTVSSEYRILNADNPSGKWKIFQTRERNLEYDIEHHENKFYILTNMGAKNFRLMETNEDNTSKDYWKEFVAHRDDVFLEDIKAFKDFLVLEERKNGLLQIRVLDFKNKSDYYLTFEDPVYAIYSSSNPEYAVSKFRFIYTSLTTPMTTIDYDISSREKLILKEEEVVDKDFNKDNYLVERHFAEARDGTKIPISLVYKKGIKLNQNTPLLLYAYGSYGYSIDASFSSVRLSLLNRGFVYAIAHIRGGQEMGRQWYEDGKLLKKKNTFFDFIDCAKYLIKENYTSSNHLYAEGGSAGGLLMGAILNLEPTLWNGVIAAVPFVDVVTTMLDESIPLTTGEFDEWGNPKDKVFYDYMLSYSPYDNVSKMDYPNILVTTGYWDSQVQYWEPAKWVAKLREFKTDNNKLFLYCDMEVGHGGASGRFKRYKETAMKYAFLLDLENIHE